MRRGLVAAVALSAGLAVVLSACSSSKNSSSSGGSGGGGGGNATLKLVAADYGPPSNTSQKYWEDRQRFHAANPNITVNVQTINWNDFDNRVKTQVQNKQYPDSRRRLLPGLRQSGLLYPAKDVTREHVQQSAAGLRQAEYLQRHAVRRAVHHQRADAVLQQKLFQQAGISSRRRRGRMSRPTRRDQGSGQGGIRASAGPGGGSG
jgi:multiple sugar transport system substrate-binding protein